MRKILKVTWVSFGMLLLTGCESFDRFEAWKMETFFGEPNPYKMPPPGTYPYAPAAYANQPLPGQPMYATQPMTVPAGSIQLQPGQPVPPGYAIVQPQAAPAPVAGTVPSLTPTGPQTLLPAAQ